MKKYERKTLEAALRTPLRWAYTRHAACLHVCILILVPIFIIRLCQETGMGTSMKDLGAALRTPLRWAYTRHAACLHVCILVLVPIFIIRLCQETGMGTNMKERPWELAWAQV